MNLPSIRMLYSNAFRISLAILLFASIKSTAQLNTPKEVISSRNRIKLIRSPEIQTELSMDARQVQAIEKLLDSVDLPLWQLRDVPIEQSNPLASSFNQQLKDGLARILRPDQYKRFNQLVMRFEGWRTLQLPSVVDELDFSQLQKDKYQVFLTEFQNLQGKSLQTIGLSEYQWIRGNLTPSQREKLTALLGKAYDFSRCTIREVKAPEIIAADQWLNSSPIKMEQLRGKVVIVTFWTFGCINCVRNLPHYKKWHSQLPKDQAVMVAFHTPETEGEHNISNLKQAVLEKKLEFPIAVDNDKANWKAWGNQIWPSIYLVDKQGYVRNWWYGELNWQGATGDKQMLDRIYQLMAEKVNKELSTNKLDSTDTARQYHPAQF